MDLTLPQMLRYGQFIGMGVSEKLTTVAVRTQLGRSHADDAAAVAVARFLALNDDTRRRDVQQIVDYVVARRRGFEEIAAQPNFTLGRRNPRTVMWEIRRWNEEVNRIRHAPQRAWASCGIGGFEQIVIDEHFEVMRWAIVELTDSSELAAEGRAMRHCVATFAWSCAQGECAIFALRGDDCAGAGGFGGAVRHVATMEVALSSRAIAQCQGPCNGRVDAKAMEIIARWAALRGVDLAKARRP
jgi:hypothetical protein